MLDDTPAPDQDADASHDEGAASRPPASYAATPLQLHAAAHLYGVRLADLEQARVLHLGCHTGEALLPFALMYPKARVVGVDMDAARIEAGREQAAALGAANLELRALAWETLDDGLGEFDYIIAQDIHTRVPSQSLEVLLALCRRSLSAAGVAMIGYRTYPGWKSAEILREAMQMHIQGAQSDAELIGKARGVLSLMEEGMALDNPYGGMLRGLVQGIRAGSDDQLVKDYLLGGIPACYFAEFATLAQDAGLAYVGDSQPHTEVPQAYGNHVGLMNSLVALGKPKTLRQQYLDFSVGRATRLSLVGHGAAAGEAAATPDMDRLRACRLAAGFARLPRVPQHPDGAKVFRACSGTRVEMAVTDPVVIRVMETLNHAWPATLAFADLAAWTYRPIGEKADQAAHEETVRRAVEFLFQKGVLRYTIGAGPCDGVPAAEGLRLAPSLARQVDAPDFPAAPTLWVFNRWGEFIDFPLQQADAFLLRHVQKGREFGKLAELLAQAFRDGVVPSVGNLANMDDDALRLQSTTLVSTLFDRLKRYGLIHGTPAAWRAHLAASLRAAGGKGTYWHDYIDALVVLARMEKASATSVPRQAGKDKDVAANKDVAEFNRLFAAGRWSEAEPVARKCLERFQDYQPLWLKLGDVMRNTGKGKDAHDALLHAIALNPLDANAHAAMGLAVHGQRLMRLAEKCYGMALSLDENNYATHVNLTNFLRDMGRLPEAEIHARRSVEIRPEAYAGHTNLGNIYFEHGKHAEALAAHRKALELVPGHMPSYSNLLFILAHSDQISPEDLIEEHRKFGRAAEKRVTGRIAAHANDRDPERKLRVGFVSADLRNHAVSSFIEPIWEAWDRGLMEIWVYGNTDREDGVTARLRTYAESWRVVVGLSDRELAETIRDDAIDVLFDLSGHTAENRLPALAYKPAPVQITWMGYPATSGMTAIDYFMTDQHMTQPGKLDDMFTEKLVYVPTVGTFKPFVGAPEVNALPALSKGHFTFGSFNRPSKIGDFTLALWARVLNAAPDTRMLLGGIASPTARELLTEKLAGHGVDPERLIFRPRANMVDYLGFHHEVDMILDTFPYTGGTTSYHALWMGVPIVTLRGKTWISAQTAGTLGQCGLPQEWITDTPDDFVARAISWPQRLEELARWRATMRGHIAGYGGRDYRTVAGHVEDAVRGMWRRWCRGEPAGSFIVEPR
jgi:predicted O-linked N-acetylglucosamine transferase (SPINDLY family)